VELVHRQGVSKKTNKPYDFWGCPEKTDGKFCEYTEKGTPSYKTADSVKLNEDHFNQIMTAIKIVNSNVQALAKMLLPEKPKTGLPPELDSEVDLSQVEF
jgi:hypothetical protein